MNINPVAQWIRENGKRVSGWKVITSEMDKETGELKVQVRDFFFETKERAEYFITRPFISRKSPELKEAVGYKYVSYYIDNENWSEGDGIPEISTYENVILEEFVDEVGEDRIVCKKQAEIELVRCLNHALSVHNEKIQAIEYNLKQLQMNTEIQDLVK